MEIITLNSSIKVNMIDYYIKEQLKFKLYKNIRLKFNSLK